jgi:hypothetical protein
MVGILFDERKIEANSRKSIPNHCAEEKTTRNSVPWKKIDKNSRNSVPKHFEVRTNHFIKLFGCLILIFFLHFSVPFQASELTLLRTSECLGMNPFFRGIIESIPSLFRRINSEQNSVASPSCLTGTPGFMVGRPVRQPYAGVDFIPQSGIYEFGY